MFYLTENDNGIHLQSGKNVVAIRVVTLYLLKHVKTICELTTCKY